MEHSCEKYILQVNKAKETVGVLENDLHQVRLILKNNPTDAAYLKELKRITLDMTITLNELEHSQTMLDQCRASNSKLEERYND